MNLIVKLKFIAMTNFDLIYKENSKAINIFISRTIKDKMLVEDLVQETFIKAFKGLDSFNSEISCISTWLHKIAKNVVIDHVRKAYEANHILVSQFATEDNEEGDKIYNFADTSTNDDQVERNELLDKILDAVENLKPKYKEIAELHFIKQMNYKEIGAMLELPEGSVKGMIFRVREMLQATLAKYAKA